jgi:hypothetical protein
MSQTLTIFAIIIASIFISLVVGQTCPGGGTNILTNPSFESPIVPSGSATSVPLDGIPGWIGVPIGSNCPESPTLDLLNNFNGYTVPDGDQYVELDAECNTVIIQNPAAVPGQLYVLSYDYSPRPGVAADSNNMNVYYNGVQINSVTADGTGLTDTMWTTYNQLVTGGPGPVDELVFESIGISDAEGALLDNVYLCPLICAPPPPCYGVVMDPVQGCTYIPAPNGTPCSTTCPFVCQAGTCVPPSVPCDEPEDHKYYPGYSYVHQEYKYKQGSEGNHYGYGYHKSQEQHYGDDDDYKYKPEHKSQHHGDDDYEYKPKHKTQHHGDDDYEYKPEPKSQEYGADDYEYKPEPKSQEYKPEPKYQDYGDDDYEYKPKHKSQHHEDDDYEYKSEYKPKDHGYKSEEDEYKPNYGGRRSHH